MAQSRQVPRVGRLAMGQGVDGGEDTETGVAATQTTEEETSTNIKVIISVHLHFF